ncbi:hypothetical protein TSUD_83250 [Trifolium subterraneum]|uniref:Uncharacterized protein n=1 Tax=Trifolium subterraneum TaxID=3900 RepID=A0A2Z6PBN7_TRISU|nr:hypothetical protein TSUD_83250 [Trifolium subterraneum]
MERDVKFLKFVTDEGIVPVNLFKCKVNTFNELKDPISEEIVPSKLFSDNPKCVNDFNLNIESGIVEFNLLPYNLNVSN